MTDVMHPPSHGFPPDRGAKRLDLSHPNIEDFRETGILPAIGCCGSFHREGSLREWRAAYNCSNGLAEEGYDAALPVTGPARLLCPKYPIAWRLPSSP